MDWIHPWIGLDWVGLDWVQFLAKKIWIGLDWVRSFVSFIVFPKTEAPSSNMFSFIGL